MENAPNAAGKMPNYRVKSIDPVMRGSDMQARLFTLAPADTIPWHTHTESADHYFVLEGALTVLTREPERASTIAAGGSHRIAPRTAHLVTNRGKTDCRFLLLQGVGRQDWVKISD